jgi:hypothetical protein
MVSPLSYMSGSRLYCSSSLDHNRRTFSAVGLNELIIHLGGVVSGARHNEKLTSVL